jgi:response regulator RpfG family c-di-GMP phosphodiesterase
MTNNRILVVDDDPVIRDLITKYLGQNGYEVDEACGGDEAFGKLRTREYGACLLDINIPEMTGLEIMEKVKDDPEFITPIVMMTGQTDIGTIIEVIRLGAEDYLPKPFLLAQIKIAVDRALRVWSIKNENIRYKFYLEDQVAIKTEGIRRSFFEMVRAFAVSIEMRDSYTGGHTKRVSEIAVLLAAGLGLDKVKQDEARIGGILHDIGKIGIADRILQKPGRLTDDEYREICRHPVIGREIVQDVESMHGMIPYILYHHERYDGSGYPEKLAGEAIPIEGRIIAVADAVDAMASHRIYRPSMTLDEVREEVVRNSGTQFDPVIVRVLCGLWDQKDLRQLLEP